MKKITVILSDDHAIFREGVRLLLEATDDIEVVGEAENGSRAVGEAKRLHPDLVVMDVVMPVLNGVEAARRIAREVPAVKVLMLSSYSDDQHLRQAVEAGVAGYLMKETASRDLLRAIRETFKGNAFFSPSIVMRMLKPWQNRDLCWEAFPQTLTSRQTEILQMIAEGHSSKQMAALLAISIKTVEKHRQSLMDKLDLHEIASLTRYAVHAGIVDSNRAPGRPIPFECLSSERVADFKIQIKKSNRRGSKATAADISPLGVHRQSKKGMHPTVQPDYLPAPRPLS